MNEELKKIAEELINLKKECRKAVTQKFLSMGKQLSKAHKICKTRKIAFNSWVEENTEITRSHAYKLMDAYKYCLTFPDKVHERITFKQVYKDIQARKKEPLCSDKATENSEVVTPQVTAKEVIKDIVEERENPFLDAAPEVKAEDPKPTPYTEQSSIQSDEQPVIHPTEQPQPAQPQEDINKQLSKERELMQCEVRKAQYQTELATKQRDTLQKRLDTEQSLNTVEDQQKLNLKKIIDIQNGRANTVLQTAMTWIKEYKGQIKLSEIITKLRSLKVEASKQEEQAKPEAITPEIVE